MWWRDLSRNGGRLLRCAAAVGFAGLLSLGAGGCGFHPLYGPTASGANLSEVMRTVEVANIPSRTGQQVRNELIFGTTGGNGGLPPVYRLEVVLREAVRNALITTSGLPTSAILQLDAEYRLVRIKDNEVVFKAYSTSEAGYNLVGATGNAGSVYGDTRAPLDAENRAARTLADTIKTRLAAYLSSAA
jgi:LPS-assembly lipoprotein